MYETTRQRICKWLLLAVLVFSTLDAALFALFDIGMERLGLRCLNSFFEFYLPELFPGKLTVYIAAFAGLAALVGWLLLLCGKRAGITVIFAVSVLPFFKSILIFLTSILALFSAADLGAQALAFAKDLLTFVTAGLPIVRTSPDHGTAYDIAGKNIADESSFRNAIYLALDVFRNRIEYDEPFSNPLKKLYHEKRDDSEKVRFSINKNREQDNKQDKEEEQL